MLIKKDSGGTFYLLSVCTFNQRHFNHEVHRLLSKAFAEHRFLGKHSLCLIKFSCESFFFKVKEKAFKENAENSFYLRNNNISTKLDEAHYFNEQDKPLSRSHVLNVFLYRSRNS